MANRPASIPLSSWIVAGQFQPARIKLSADQMRIIGIPTKSERRRGKSAVPSMRSARNSRMGCRPTSPIRKSGAVSSRFSRNNLGSLLRLTPSLVPEAVDKVG